MVCYIWIRCIEVSKGMLRYKRYALEISTFQFISLHNCFSHFRLKMRQKSNLTLNRKKTHKMQPNIKTLKLLKSSWIRTEHEIFCYSSKTLSPVYRTEITLKETVFSGKCVRITPSKTGTPRKQLKRNLLKSPKELSRHSINDKKTLSKSPSQRRSESALKMNSSIIMVLKLHVVHFILDHH